MTTQTFRSTALSATLLLALVPAATAQPTSYSAMLFESGSAISMEVSTASLSALLDQTDAVLATLWSNPEAVAARTHAPERAASDFARFALATVAAVGPYVSHETLGAAPAEMDRTYTYARVRFAEATVAVRLTWKDGRLVTVTRGEAPASPMVAGF